MWLEDHDRNYSWYEVHEDLKNNRPLTVSVAECSDGENVEVCEVTLPKTLVRAIEDPDDWFLFSGISGIDNEVQTAEKSKEICQLEGRPKIGETLILSYMLEGERVPFRMKRIDKLADVGEPNGELDSNHGEQTRFANGLSTGSCVLEVPQHAPSQ